MKSRESVLRLKQFQVQEKARQVAQIEAMIADFARMADDLNAQIAYEEKRAGIEDPEHFAYPTFAKAARQRRENLATSQKDLTDQKEAAAAALREVEAELAKLEAKESRDTKTLDAQSRTAAYERAGMIG